MSAAHGLPPPVISSPPRCLSQTVATDSSANFYSDISVARIRGRDRSKPFYLHLTYQSVHGPYEEPPAWEQIDAHSAYTGDHACECDDPAATHCTRPA